MPTSIKLRVRESEKNATKLFVMRNYFLELILIYMSIKNNLDVEEAKQQINSLNQKYSKRFQRTKFDSEIVGHIYYLATILGTSESNCLKEIDNLYNKLSISSHSGRILKFATLFQVISYAFLERFQGDQQKLRSFADSLLKNFASNPILFFPALTILMDLKTVNDQPIFNFTDEDCRKIWPVLQRFDQKNFPYVYDQHSENLYIHFNSTSNSYEKNQISSYFQNIEHAGSCEGISILERKEKQNVIRKRLGYFAALTVTTLGTVTGLLLGHYYFIPGTVPAIAFAFGFLLPFGLAATVLIGIGAATLLERCFGNGYSSFDARIDSVENEIDNVRFKLVIDFLRDIKPQEESFPPSENYSLPLRNKATDSNTQQRTGPPLIKNS